MSPSATQNKVLEAEKAAIQKAATIQKALANQSNGPIQLDLNVAIPTESQSRIQNLDTFKECKNKHCIWNASPWPFQGISLSPAGILHGTPTKIATATVEVMATDSEGKSYDSFVDIQVKPTKPTITTLELPRYPVGQPINEVLNADPLGIYQWEFVESPTLPEGVTLNSNGVLSGTANTPKTYKFTAKIKSDDGTVLDSRELELVIAPAPDCNNAKYNGSYYKVLFPLSSKFKTDPLGNSPNGQQFATEPDVQCFYNASGLVSAVGQVQYLYGFGGGANTLSADLVSVQMPAPIGMQVSFGSSITGGGGTGAPATSSNSTNQSQPSVSGAIQAVEAGGNFYIHTVYPIAQYNSQHLSAYFYADPRVGFSFNGFAGQATLSQGSEQYFNAPVEFYGSYDGIGHSGGIYLDYRGGFESVPGSFAHTAQLSHHNFMLQQLAVGFNFVGLFRIGAQRYFGPSAAFNAANTTAGTFDSGTLFFSCRRRRNKLFRR